MSRSGAKRIDSQRDIPFKLGGPLLGERLERYGTSNWSLWETDMTTGSDSNLSKNLSNAEFQRDELVTVLKWRAWNAPT